MPSTRRLCVCGGLWQLITLTAALRDTREEPAAAAGDARFEDHLLLYFVKAAPAAHRVLRLAAERLWPWSTLTIIEAPSEKKRSAPLYQQLLKLSQEKKWEGRPPQEIWISRLFDAREAAVVEAFPNAGIVLYEDGLHSYAPPWDGWDLRGLARRTVGEWIPQLRARKATVSRRHVRRIIALRWILTATLPLPRLLPAHRLKQVRTDAFRLALSSLTDAMADEWSLPIHGDHAVGHRNRRALLLGQPFAMNSTFTPEQELAIYRDVCHDVIASGSTILWKDHPRQDPPLGPRLAAEFLGQDLFAVVQAPPQVPAESLVTPLEIDTCVSITSTSLYYLPLLSNVQTRTIADRVQFRAGSGYEKMRQLTLQYIPTLERDAGAVG